MKTTLARRSFRAFVEAAWPILEPKTPFLPGIHVDAVCDHLQAVTEGRIKDLIINIPPGHAKSMFTAVFWPAWMWIDYPQTRWIFGSYNAALAIRDSVKCRSLISSDWYQSRWSDSFTLQDDQNQKQRFVNSRTGYRVATSVGGSGTGERADIVVVDDPTSVDEAESDAARKAANEWWNGTMSTRLNSIRDGHLVVIQQRLHEDDLTGNLIEQGGYDHLMLPEEFEPDRRATTSIGWTDPRTEAGELLWPAKNGPTEVASLKVKLGSYRYAGQYQQRPAPAGGGLLKRCWWRYWKPAGSGFGPVSVRGLDGSIQQIDAIELPETFDRVSQSWDAAFKDLKTSDFLVGQVWAAKKADRFLLDQVRGRMDFPATLAAVKAMSAKWPNATRKYIEDKANGSAIISSLKREIAGLIAINPEGGKIARAQAVSAQIESGNVFLPHPSMASWIESFIHEATLFPNGKNDDQIDACTQALNQMGGGTHRQGLIEYEKQLAAEMLIPKQPLRVPDVEVCPTCSSTCVSQAGTRLQRRCGQCGKQWHIEMKSDPDSLNWPARRW